ncbi:biotin biosynthesis protein BioC [Roseovarius albus]|uniref:Biotin biosynthesis protein BioC n=1 Tax=Roseovarius albus TaxID=1247867 RepID=A0A1X6ZPX1_9RHOB|nr:methyltransferase domain-containing protein [Roseovarius albus]SLN56084.1 biotin biosynthesis protein BioC [Roseovarius albus]
MTPVTIDRVERSFGRSFQSYASSASQQARIARHLARRLCDLGAPDHFHNTFEFGCGTGNLTRALQEHFTFGDRTLNDLTAEARETAKAFDASFLPGDVRDILWPRTPDLIASASTIQWLDNPEQIVLRAAQELAPGGWLAISSFGPQQYCELAELGSTAGAPGLRGAQDLTQSLANDPIISIHEYDEDYHQLWFDSPTDVLKHLRKTGVNAGAAQGWTRANLNQFYDQYLEKFGTAQGVPLTYHATWVIARKHG